MPSLSSVHPALRFRFLKFFFFFFFLYVVRCDRLAFHLSIQFFFFFCPGPLTSSFSFSSFLERFGAHPTPFFFPTVQPVIKNPWYQSLSRPGRRRSFFCQLFPFLPSAQLAKAQVHFSLSPSPPPGQQMKGCSMWSTISPDSHFSCGPSSFPSDNDFHFFFTPPPKWYWFRLMFFCFSDPPKKPLLCVCRF